MSIASGQRLSGFPSCGRDFPVHASTEAFMVVFSFQERGRTEQLRASVRVHADCRTPLPDPPDPSQQTRPLAPDAEQPPGDPWPLASQGVLNLPSAKGCTAVASEGGVLGPQLSSRVAAEPAATVPLQGDGAWCWCGCTAAEGEGSGRCYLWGDARKCFKNVCHPCQTFFIWCRHSDRLVLVVNFSVGKNKGWGCRFCSAFLAVRPCLQFRSVRARKSREANLRFKITGYQD